MGRRLIEQVAALAKDVAALQREVASVSPKAAAETRATQRAERIAWGARMGPSGWRHLSTTEAAEAKRICDENHSDAARERQLQEQIASAKAVGHEYIGGLG
jgi:hypothetical protein